MNKDGLVYPKQTKKELWRQAYERLQEQCRPAWLRYDALRKPFYDTFDPSKGAFSKQYDKVLGAAYNRYEAEKEPYMKEYAEKCRKLGVNIDIVSNRSFERKELKV